MLEYYPSTIVTDRSSLEPWRQYELEMHLEHNYYYFRGVQRGDLAEKCSKPAVESQREAFGALEMFHVPLQLQLARLGLD